MMRTHYCGQLRKSDIGDRVKVCGWVQARRDMGGVIFIDLKDREGVLQVVCDQRALKAEDFHLAETVRNQSVIQLGGIIRLRSADTVNDKIPTGEVELAADSLAVLSAADPLPFVIDDDAGVREDLRLKYRFLDIRRPGMLKNLRFRHKVQQAAEHYLDAHGFIAVETPMLTKSTPEGARDYLVPSRVHPGKFYALPQSPQIFKQLLMVGGVDKYYQVARCFRDEDLRADRQPEFTQVDMEMSFVEQEEILVHLESLFKSIFEEVMGYPVDYAFPRITWQTAMDVYGSDKPDLRFDLPIVDVTDIARTCTFGVFRKTCESGGVVRAINAKGCESWPRSTVEELTEKALGYGAKGMAWIAIRPDGSINSIMTKYFTEEEFAALLEKCDAKPGDFVLFCADQLATVRRTLGGLRLDIAELLGLRDKKKFQFLFVTDFPEFEWSEEENRWMAMHHPFTMPYPEDLDYLLTAPERVRAQAYDVVLNGVELGSGSIRIHRRDIQQRMFEALGFSDEQIEERFGFMVNAFRYGTPPHGGFAFGLDRFVMLLLGADSLRDVIAFPKVRDASCLMTQAPNFVDDEQLDALELLKGIRTAQQKQRAEQTTGGIDVEKIANLARLNLTEQEKVELPRQMQTIIDFADQLSAVQDDGVEATEHVNPVWNVLREDVAIPGLDRDLALSTAKNRADGYIAVPKTFD